jgi:hypothetical protein
VDEAPIARRADAGGDPLYALVGRRLARDGQPLGGEFVVSDSSSSEVPAIASDAAGRFVVVWREGPVESSPTIRGRRYAADGSALGDSFEVHPSSGIERVRLGALSPKAVAWRARLRLVRLAPLVADRARRELSAASVPSPAAP